MEVSTMPTGIQAPRCVPACIHACMPGSDEGATCVRVRGRVCGEGVRGGGGGREGGTGSSHISTIAFLGGLRTISIPRSAPAIHRFTCSVSTRMVDKTPVCYERGDRLSDAVRFLYFAG